MRCHLQKERPAPGSRAHLPQVAPSLSQLHLLRPVTEQSFLGPDIPAQKPGSVEHAGHPSVHHLANCGFTFLALAQLSL